jgi:hypothetical protein
MPLPPTIPWYGRNYHLHKPQVFLLYLSEPQPAKAARNNRSPEAATELFVGLACAGDDPVAGAACR